MLGPIVNIFANRKFEIAWAAIGFLALSVAAYGEGDSSRADVRHRGLPVVSFSASLQGGYLVVEAELAPDWHTYAMDNIERAREKSGKERPDCELPTQFALEGPIELTGAWRQTDPIDLSNPDIHWYTWGYEDRAAFAVPVQVTGGGDVAITINGQACNASSCSMIQDVKLVIDAKSSSEARGTDVDIDALVPAQSSRDF